MLLNKGDTFNFKVLQLDTIVLKNLDLLATVLRTQLESFHKDLLPALVDNAVEYKNIRNKVLR